MIKGTVAMVNEMTDMLRGDKKIHIVNEQGIEDIMFTCV